MPPGSAGAQLVNPLRSLVVVKGMGTSMSTQLTRSASTRLLLRIAGAGLLFAIGGIHLDLYLTGYRTIPTIGWLFLLQVIAAFILGAAMLVSRSRLVAAAGAGLAISTLGGYLLTVQFGLFGFREVRTTAGIVAGVIEVVAFALLAVLAAWPDRSAEAGRAERPVDGDQERGARRGLADLLQRGIPHAGAAVAGLSVVALVLLGLAVAGAGPSSAAGGARAATNGPGGGLRTAQIDGQTVLTNASGLTLYTFAPDSVNKSVCYGSCATYWPPVPGHLTAGTGVTGKLGTFARTGGGTQETYNGHPLYTYVGDTGPGQAHGNNLNLNGGLWHVVPVSG